MKIKVTMFCLFVTLWLPIQSNADVIFDNGAPDDSGGTGVTSDLGANSAQYTAADDFVLQAGAIS